MLRSFPYRLGISNFARWPSLACLLLVSVFSLSICPALVHADQDNVDSATTATSTSPKDAETLRFESELKQFELRENVVASFVYAFQIASPELRAELWQQLEKDKTAEKISKTEADAYKTQSRPAGYYDAETLRYKAAVEELDLSAELVEDLIEMFRSNEAPFRKILWERVEENTLNQN